MATSGSNVIRWSALFAGVAYAFFHQRSLSSQQQANEAKRHYNQQESLITKAKAEYLKKTMPQDKLTAGGNVISDPDDPNFDLEAYLTMKAAGEQ